MANQHDEVNANATVKQDILNNVQRTILAAQRCFDSDDVDCRQIKLDLRQASRSMLAIQASIDEDNYSAVVDTLTAFIDQIDLKIQNEVDNPESCFTAPRETSNGQRGRPKLCLDEGQLSLFQKLNYTVKQMAEHFGCCEKLVSRRLHNLGLPQRRKYSTLSDAELDNVVDKTQKEFTNSGSVMMGGILRTKGVVVQRQRLRASIGRINPVSVAHRLGQTVSRRKYSVLMSNSLWHIDGHMKLIRWGISTHGGIDGYSRLIVFLNADTNNKASTVLQHFISACQKYSVPSRARSDFGGENVMVALFMNLLNGQDRHSHITGRSVHNQRIERLWRDVYMQVVEKYYKLFYDMEDQGLLDPENGFHILAIEYAFVPAINEQLELFRMGWNSHKLSTENHLSPHQMWLNGILKHLNSSSIVVRNMYGSSLAQTLEDRLRGYGLDPENFTEDEQPQTVNALDVEVVEDLLSFISNETTPASRYTKCLEYFQRYEDGDSD